MYVALSWSQHALACPGRDVKRDVERSFECGKVFVVVKGAEGSVWNLRKRLHQWGGKHMVVQIHVLLLQVQLVVLHPTAIILMSVVLSAFMKAESAFITGLRGRCLSCFNFGLFFVLQNVFKFRFSLKTRGEIRLLCCIHYAKFKKKLKVKIALEKGTSQTAPSACVTNIP